MLKKEKSFWTYLIFIIGIGLICSWNKCIELVSISLDWMKLIAELLNDIVIKFTGDGLITTVFMHLITYGLVGIIFYFIPLRKKIGSLFGKVCYWLTSGIVGTILNYINAKIFNL